MERDLTDLGLSPAPAPVPTEPGFARYRHPQGWTMLQPIPDVENPPEVIDVDGHLMHLCQGLMRFVEGKHA